ncbi:MAG TPA: hypothetical protein VEC35_13700 [Noviherbaspirillum sp.]|nr:hypothetical protein [Noviherbaspirillum sp.]
MHTHTHTTTRRVHNLFAIPLKAGARLARWAARTMKITMQPGRHRMGSWEEHASFRARALHDVSRE